MVSEGPFPNGNLHETHLSNRTIADWYSFAREVMRDAIDIRFRNRGPIGGLNYTIELNESKIGHRKANRGRVVDGSWVLGMICRATGWLIFTLYVAYYSFPIFVHVRHYNIEIFRTKVNMVMG